MTLYFAYGSNLNIEQMRSRCPAAVPLGPCNLSGYRLVFRGVADIAPVEGGTVAGGLWRITADCEAALDRYEGVSSRLYRKEYIEVAMEDGSKEDALVYIMNSKSIVPPGDYYLQTIADGYVDFGLDPATLRDAVMRSVTHAVIAKGKNKRLKVA